MDIITEEQVEAARVAHAELVQERERQLMLQRKVEREAKENATHALELERTKNGDYSGTYTVGDLRIQVQATNGYSAEDRKKARVYVDGEPDVDFTEAYAMQRANTESYGSPSYPRGTFPAEDKLFRDLNRVIVNGKRDIVAQATTESADLAELLKSVKLHFSRTAGCSCGCSPAFIASSHITVQHDGRNLNVTSIFVSKKEVSA